MKIALLNDTHCGIRNSSDIFIDYQEKFYTDVFFPYLLENDIKHIIHLGDYYEHRRFINFKALSANRKHFLDKLREYGITMDIIPGNHDVYYKNTNDLNSLKELLGHYMNEVTIIQTNGKSIKKVKNARESVTSKEFRALDRRYLCTWLIKFYSLRR